MLPSKAAISGVSFAIASARKQKGGEFKSGCETKRWCLGGQHSLSRAQTSEVRWRCGAAFLPHLFFFFFHKNCLG